MSNLERLVIEQMDYLRKAGFFNPAQVGKSFSEISFGGEMTSKLSASDLLLSLESKHQFFDLHLPQKGISPGGEVEFRLKYRLERTVIDPLELVSLTVRENHNKREYVRGGHSMRDYVDDIVGSMILPPEVYLNHWANINSPEGNRPNGYFRDLLKEPIHILHEKGYLKKDLNMNNPNSPFAVQQRMQLEMRRIEATGTENPKPRTFQIPISLWDLDAMEKFEHSLHLGYTPGGPLKIEALVSSMYDARINTPITINKGLPEAKTIHKDLVGVMERLYRAEDHRVSHRPGF